MYYNSKTAMKITGVSRAKLQYWDRCGIVKPHVSASGRGSQRLYDFRGLVELKTANVLRKEGLSLQRLRKVLSYLRKEFKDINKPLAELTFLTDGNTVFVLDRDAEALLDVLRRQFVLSIPFGKIVEELRVQVKELSSERDQTVTVRGLDYIVTLTPDFEDGGFSIRCPSLPANSQGKTEQEAIDNIIDAIEAYLDVKEEIEKEKSVEAVG